MKPRSLKSKSSQVLRAPVVTGKYHSRVEVLGVYSLPFQEHILLVEVLQHISLRLTHPSKFRVPSQLDESGRDHGHHAFWLNADGTQLLGAHTDAPHLPAPTRFAFLLYACPFPFTLTTPGGKVRIRRVDPVPERLLRLIWVE